jgi:predicted transcriptional regulator
MSKSKEDQEARIIINDFTLNRRHIKVLLSLAEAPDDKKTIHYLSMVMNVSFYKIYHDIKTLTDIDFIKPIKLEHSNNKVLYFPDNKIIEAIKKTLANTEDKNETK